MHAQAPFWLDDNNITFPDVSLALREPNGLLAIGGDLSPERLITAYRSGIFPWFQADQPILWWSPDPRALLFLDQFKISRSLQKTLNKNIFQITFNQCFVAVITACAKLRTEGTWITTAMIKAYQQLHQAGVAHSVEVWLDNQLVGGLYGLTIGKIFCGESMFSIVTDASKVAMVFLVRTLLDQNFAFIDCQMPTPHLLSLGASVVPRQQFMELLQQYRD